VRKFVILSGYSQRLNKATGKIYDDYLYSYRIDREKFTKIDFTVLEKVDLIMAIDLFEKKKITTAGIFKLIKPFLK
jgi:hypothetical protein